MHKKRTDNFEGGEGIFLLILLIKKSNLLQKNKFNKYKDKNGLDEAGQR